ncbi:MAG TPA: L,D-transpeptidase/peptidoglycan binding protein [Actinomycetota bacterium]|nr:L,D-transpeptidase/peptidoglycan binding protein [Actinomycetota bacterium]
MNILPSRNRRTLAWVGGIASCFLIAGSGAATAALRFEARRSQTVLPGVSVSGVAVGGLHFGQVRAKLTERFGEPLSRPITVEVGGMEYTTSPEELGVTNNLNEVIDQTISLQSMPLFKRVWHRVTGIPLQQRYVIASKADDDKIDSFVNSLSRLVDRPARDASVELVDGVVKITPEQQGFAIDSKASIQSLKRAALSDAVKVRLEGKSTDAVLKKADVKDVIVVKVGENKLFHYRGEELVKTYDVATGLAKYPTPIGQFKIVNKRFKPTWVNPAKYPGGWGWSLPAKIGPGPGNPLGTRAMDLNSPGIRIHGSYAAYSMGYNASHGCIRMRIADVEELFGLVEVGTPVLIVRSGPNRSMPARLRSTAPEPLAESDGSEVPGQTQPTPAASPTPTASPLLTG